MNEITLRARFVASDPTASDTLVGAYTAPYQCGSGALLAQVTGTAGAIVTLWGSNLPEDPSSWVSIGGAEAADSTELETGYAWIRASASAPCSVSVSSPQWRASAGGAGGGGGGTAGATETTAAAQLVALTSIDAKLPTQDTAGADVVSPADHAAVAEWDLTGVLPADIVHADATRNQRVIALTADPTSTGYSEMRAALTVDTPADVTAGISISQRVRMDAQVYGLVDRTALVTVPGPWTIATISQSGTTCTIVLTTPFVGRLGTPIDISGAVDNRLWYQFAPVASISEDRLTITVGVTDGAAIPSLTIGALSGGSVSYSPDPLGLAATGAAWVYNSSTTTSAVLLARSGGVTRLASAVTSITGDQRSSTASTSRALLAGGAAVAHAATSEFRLDVVPGEVHFLDRPADTVVAYSARAMIASAAMATARTLRPVIGNGSSAAMVRPLARIVSAVRAANVVTLTLDRPAAAAGFAVGLYPQIYGIRDQANFGNSVPATAITGVSGNTVTLAWTGTDATSYGGGLALTAGGLTQQGLVAQTAQAVTVLADGTLAVTGSATWAGLSVDDVVWLVGVRNATTGADLGLDGPWSVQRTNAAVLSLSPLTDISGARRSPAAAPAASVNCGGAVLLASTIRVHNLRAVERRLNESRIWGQGTNSAGHALPVYVNSGALSVVQGTAASATGGTLGWPVAPGIVQATDLASGAITTTTTSGPYTLTGNSGGTTAFQLVVNVTAVSGTSPTMDCSIEVQDDGARWYKLFDLPRITAAGQYSTPELRTDARAYRIVQTLGGTSPSFTRSIVRNSLPFQQARHICQSIDRTVSLTTLGAATPALYVDGPADLHLLVNIGAATTPPALQLQLSEDNGATWVSVGSPVAAVASGTVKTRVSGEYPRHARAIVTTAGAGVTMGYVLVKAVG